MARIIGLASEPSTNRIIQDSNHEASVCCAADILLTGIQADVKGEALCPVCGVKISVTVERRKVVSVEPESSVLHYVVQEMKNGLGICCAQTFMFDKKPCLDAWLKSDGVRIGRISSFQEFLDFAMARPTPG